MKQSSFEHQSARLWIWAACIGLFIFVLAARIAGPSDGFDNEQPKTIAYTVDVIANGRAILPRDMFGRAPHKPPLYNWLSVPVVAGFNQYTEWAFKLPTIIAMALAMGLTAAAGRWMLMRRRDSLNEADAGVLARLSPMEIGLISAAMLLASHTGTKFLYLARPDTLMLFFATGGWLAATVALLDERKRWWVNLLCWLCMAGVAMCKGPPALLIPLYAVLGARLLTGQWSSVWRTGMAWGLPLAIVLFGAWLGAAYIIDQRAVVEELLGDQAAGKIVRRGWWRIFTEFYKAPGYLILRFLPWSLIAILTLLHIPPRRWFKHALGPAVLWALLVLGFFTIPADKRGDYYAPAMPALAILAAYWLLVVAAKYRITPARTLLAAAVIAVGFVAFEWKGSEAAGGMGDGVKAFASEIRGMTNIDDVVFIEPGYHNLQAYLGVNQAGPPTPEMIETARWVVMPASRAPAGATAAAKSVPVKMWPEQGNGELGLYPIKDIDLESR